jgi:ribosome-binding factor A
MSKNIQRTAEDIRREIGATMNELTFDTVVSVSHCDLSNDLSYCKVYISTFEGGEKTIEAVERLKGASGIFKRNINSRIKMRKIPELIFLPDNSLDYYDKITGIIDELNAGKASPEQGANP